MSNPSRVRQYACLAFLLSIVTDCAAARGMQSGRHQWKPNGKLTTARTSLAESVDGCTLPPQSQRNDASMYRTMHAVSQMSEVDMTFPPLPTDRAPDSDSWKVSLAICTVLKDEVLGDVKEWVAYHRWLGVDKIHVTEDRESVSEALREGLAEEVASGFVELESIRDKIKKGPAQVPGFANCFRKLRSTYTWVAFFDVDEYLMVLEEGQTIKGLLNEYKEHPALAINWNSFGSSGRVKKIPEGGMLRWYMQCYPRKEKQIKSIVNSYYMLAMWIHPHNFFYRDKRKAVTENFIPTEPLEGDQICGVPDDCVTGETQCMDPPTWKFHDGQDEPKRMSLFHYGIRSREDFEEKIERGGGDGNHRTWRFFNLTDENASSTGGICDYGIRAWAKCCTHLAE